jgi:hypothetical protein
MREIMAGLLRATVGALVMTGCRPGSPVSTPSECVTATYGEDSFVRGMCVHLGRLMTRSSRSALRRPRGTSPYFYCAGKSDTYFEDEKRPKSSNVEDDAYGLVHCLKTLRPEPSNSSPLIGLSPSSGYLKPKPGPR